MNSCLPPPAPLLPGSGSCFTPLTGRSPKVPEGLGCPTQHTEDNDLQQPRFGVHFKPLGGFGALRSDCGSCETRWTLHSLRCATIVWQPAGCHSSSGGKAKPLSTSAHLLTRSRAGPCHQAPGVEGRPHVPLHVRTGTGHHTRL